MEKKKRGISRTVRRIFAEEYRKRLEGLAAPEEVLCITDLVYGEDPVWQSLDLYIPEGREKNPLPVIVNVHGGGWVYGTKEDYRLYCMKLASGGFKVVNFTYRLCPEFSFPAPLEDTGLVFRWVEEHAEEYGLDCSNLFAVGESAGAHTLCTYACIVSNPAYAKAFEAYDIRIPDGPIPKAIALNSGIYLMDEDGCSDPMTLALMKEMLPEGGNAKERELVDLTRHITADFPPVTLMTCEGDFAAEHSRRLLKVLEERGISCQMDYYGGPEHVLEHAFELNLKLPEAEICTRRQLNFFGDMMKDHEQEKKDEFNKKKMAGSGCQLSD